LGPPFRLTLTKPPAAYFITNGGSAFNVIVPNQGICGVAQWSSRLHEDQKIRVRIQPGNKFFWENIDSNVEGNLELDCTACVFTYNET
jgi:hypothetical protein